MNDGSGLANPSGHPGRPGHLETAAVPAYTRRLRAHRAMARIARLRMGRRNVACRMIALFRASEDDVADLLPNGMRPHLVRGKAVASLCYTRLLTLRSRWLPNHPGTPTDHLAVRIAAERSDGLVSFVFRRDTSSWFEARCEKLTRANYHHSHFDLDYDRCQLRLSVSSDDEDELLVEGTARPSSTLARDSIFGSSRAAEGFLRSTWRAVPSDTFAPEADRLQTRNDAALEPLEVSLLRAHRLERLRPKAFELDCALRFVTTQLLPHRAPALEAARGERGAASSVQPAL